MKLLHEAASRPGWRAPVVLALLLLTLLTSVKLLAKDVNLKRNAGAERYFVENKGQWDARARYMSKGENLNMWFTDSAVIYDYYTIIDHDSARFDEKIYEDPYDHFMSDSLERRGQVVKVEFVEPRGKKVKEKNRERHIRTRKKSGAKNHYVHSKAKKRVNGTADKYGELLDEEVYKNTSLRYYFEDGKVRYDIEVNPGGDPEEIRMQFTGADSLSINKAGELQLHTNLGDIVHGGLFTFQHATKAELERAEEAADKRQKDKDKDKDKDADEGDVELKIVDRKRVVETSFVIENKNTVKFKVGTYDKERQLIIDPFVTSSVHGGTSTEVLIDSEVDNYGNIYLVGSTESSTGFPTTLGAYQTALAGNEDIFVMKFDQSGRQNIWTTLVGGPNDDRAYSVRIQSSTGNVIVSGFAGTGFPQLNPVQQNYGGGNRDGVVLSLGPNGDNLVFSTYLGSSGNDVVYDVDEGDGYNKLFVCGYAFGSDLATTSGVFQPNKSGGNRDAMVGLLDLSNSTISYLSYLGGNDNDHLYKIEALDNGRSVVCGFTKSSANYPTTTNAHQQTFAGGGYDCVLTVISSGGTSLEYSTLIGGSGNDRAHSLFVNDNEEIYLTGLTGSSTFPISTGAYDATYNGGSTDAFVLKFSTQGTITHSTFFGAGDVESGLDICPSMSGGILIVGQTHSTSIPQVGEVLDNVDNGGMDVFISSFDLTLENLTWSAIYGGTNDDNAQAVLIDQFGRVVVAGSTNSSDFPEVTN